jgi:hypothetical protein
MTTIVFELPDKALTMNQRLHWAVKSRTSRAWRNAAAAAAIDAGVHDLAPMRVTVEIPVMGNRRRDPHNWFPTVKPIIDGLVDAGVWPDDTPEWVQCTEPRLTVGGSLVRIHMEPR